MKKVIKYFIIILLVLAEAYLLITYIGGNVRDKEEVKIFCEEKCAYNGGSYLWEFAGENAVRGFTTKNECNNYCVKFKQGFVYNTITDAQNFLGSLLRR